MKILAILFGIKYTFLDVNTRKYKTLYWFRGKIIKEQIIYN